MQKEQKSEMNDPRRTARPKLNNLIEDNADNSEFKWKETEKEEVPELGETIEESRGV